MEGNYQKYFMRHLHRSSVFYKIIQWHGKHAKTYFSLVVPAKNYICPALILMSNLRIRLNYTVVSGKRESFLLKGNDFQISSTMVIHDEILLNTFLCQTISFKK